MKNFPISKFQKLQTSLGNFATKKFTTVLIVELKIRNFTAVLLDWPKSSRRPKNSFKSRLSKCCMEFCVFFFERRRNLFNMKKNFTFDSIASSFCMNFVVLHSEPIDSGFMSSISSLEIFAWSYCRFNVFLVMIKKFHDEFVIKIDC